MKVQIYGKSGCKYCDMVRNLCEQNGVDYSYQMVGTDLTVEQLVEMCGKPVRTVPQVFVTSGGLTEYVGGYDDFKQYLNGSKV